MLIACFSVVFPVNNLYAQEVWEEIAEQWADDEEENTLQWENLLEDLNDLKEHPINLNTATKEQLERFPSLSAHLIENILYYLYKYGAMLSDKELMMVEGMDRKTARCLLPFITFQQPEIEIDKLNLKQVLKYGKHELSTRVDIPFYRKSGYQSLDYVGHPFYHNLRYNFRYKDRINVGITAEKDAGEPFFAGRNRKGYDYYSPYVFIRNVGRIKALAIGNYRLSYGYGLVMNTDFSLGKTSMLSTFSNKPQGIKKHSSTDEYNYFQGIAGSYQLTSRWTIDAFYSYRKMDGTVDNQFITSLKKDGLHRIQKDFEKKNTFTNQLIGSNIHYNGKYFKAGLTAVYNIFNKVLNPTFRSYNKYYPRGRDFLNVGMNYKVFGKRFSFMGETSFDKTGKIATINLFRYSPKESFQLMVMNRFYDVAYQSFYARSIGEGSNVQNESGLYIGLETNLLHYFKLMAYGDFFYFPWKKYQVSKKETNGFDGVVQLSYSPNNELDMFIKYRYKNKYKDFTNSNEEKSTIPYIQQKWKYQLNYSPMNHLSLKTTVNYVRNAYQSQNPSQGILIDQQVGYKLDKIPLRLDAHIAWFHTDDYVSRISIYEKGLLYTFSIPSFYGKGERYAVNVHYEWNEHVIFQIKYAMTHYRDRKVIGSGLEQINGIRKSDLYMQLRWKF